MDKKKNHTYIYMYSEEPKKEGKKKKPRETLPGIIFTHQEFAPLLADSSPEAAEFFQSWLCSLFPAV